MAQALSRPERSLSLVRGLWIGLLSLYFLLPLVGTAVYSLWAGGNRYNFSAYLQLLAAADFRRSLELSLVLALETVLLTLGLLVPAVFWANLKLKRLRGFLDVVSVLPFVVPPIVLASGLSAAYGRVSFLVSSPHFLVLPYVILALPYSYRALDTGMRALDIKTLTEAAQSLGASWGVILFRVVVPNLRTSLIGAALLTLAIVVGEFTFANVLLYNTFAVYLNYVGQTQGTASAALSLLSFALTWLGMLGITVGAKRNQVAFGGPR